eukprot:g39784.t1
MWLVSLVCSLLSQVVSSTVLFDFTNSGSTVTGWTEVSDTVRTVGLSTGVLHIIPAQTNRRAVFFSLLVPQANGACFAGQKYRFSSLQDFSSFSSVVLTGVRGKGDNYIYKVVLQDTNVNTSITFESFFTAPTVTAVIELPLTSFVCDYRGATCDQQLNVQAISSIGLQIAGGVYNPDMAQGGASSLELATMSLSPSVSGVRQRRQLEPERS